MNSPPASFYSAIGYVGIVVAPLLAILTASRLRSTAGAIPAVSVISCPIFFAFIFTTASLLYKFGGFSDPSANLELYTIESAGYQFLTYALSLLVAGFLIGALAGGFIFFVFKKRRLNGNDMSK